MSEVQSRLDQRSQEADAESARLEAMIQELRSQVEELSTKGPEDGAEAAAAMAASRAVAEAEAASAAGMAAEAEARAVGLQADLDRIQADLDRIRSEASDWEQRAMELQQQLDDSEAALLRSEAQLEVQREADAAAASEVEEMRQAYTAISGQLDALKEQYEALQGQYDADQERYALMDEIHGRGAQVLQAELEAARQGHAAATFELDILREQYKVVQGQYSELSRLLDVSQEELRLMQADAMQVRKAPGRGIGQMRWKIRNKRIPKPVPDCLGSASAQVTNPCRYPPKETEALKERITALEAQLASSASAIGMTREGDGGGGPVTSAGAPREAGEVPGDALPKVQEPGMGWGADGDGLGAGDGGWEGQEMLLPLGPAAEPQAVDTVPEDNGVAGTPPLDEEAANPTPEDGAPAGPPDPDVNEQEADPDLRQRLEELEYQQEELNRQVWEDERGADEAHLTLA